MPGTSFAKWKSRDLTTHDSIRLCLRLFRGRRSLKVTSAWTCTISRGQASSCTTATKEPTSCSPSAPTTSATRSRTRTECASPNAQAHQVRSICTDLGIWHLAFGLFQQLAFGIFGIGHFCPRFSFCLVLKRPPVHGCRFGLQQRDAAVGKATRIRICCSFGHQR